MNKTHQDYWSPLVHQLTPYVPGEQPKISQLIKLNTNENPYGPSPAVLAAIQAELSDALRLYPDPNAERLKEAIATYYHVTPSQVFVGNGSDEVLAFAFQALFQHPPAPLLFPDITYSFYPVYCGLYGIPYKTVPLDDDFRLQVADYRRPNAGIIFANPNAPTGCLLPLDDIERLLRHNRNTVIVVDEAYIDFGGETAIGLVNRYPNLLVTQTLSKSRSLAGLRIGLAIGDAELIEALERIKNSFNSYPLDRLAIAGGVAAFADRAHFERNRQAVITSRIELIAQLEQLGFIVLPSAANFVFARHPRLDAAVLAAALRERRVLVRHFRRPRIAQFLRITVGNPQQNAALLAALRQILTEH
jgi:histidinol-phosphate aminotransferase